LNFAMLYVSFVLFVIVGVFSLLGWCTLGGAAVSAAPTELLVQFFGWLVHFLVGWCTLGGAAVSAAPTELLVLSLDWCTFCFVGALETSAPPCVHPLVMQMYCFFVM
jgi:hypothetical protein